MNQELFARLRAAGISETEATSISKSYGPATPDDVDVDRLTKAMEGVAASFGDDSQSAVDDAVQEASDIVDAVTKGADALLAEQRTQYEALAKGMLALADEVRDLREQGVSASPLTKSLTNSEPMLRKSVSSDNVDIIGAPGDLQKGSVAMGYQALINKALTELKATDDVTRQSELSKAISGLESGIPAATIRQNYSI